MDATFEAEKNRKALSYTAIICAILILLAIFITWPLLKPPVPVAEDLIEINLGNDMEGFGETQPLIKGDMSPTQSQPEAQQARAAITPDEPAKDIEEDNDEEAVPVPKPEKPSPKANTIAKEPSTKTVKTKAPAPVVMPAPKPQKPVATYNGPGKGNGNGATEDNGYRYQGNNPNGKGDAGSPAGKPDSYGNSPGGKTGASISRGLTGRRITYFPSYQDEFNENAKVAVDVSVDKQGKVLSATYQPKGSTTSNSFYKQKAIEKVKQSKLNPDPAGDDVQTGTIIINFKVTN